MSATKQVVEFVGGPYDGLRHPVSLSVQELRGEVFLPVTRDIFCLIEGAPRQVDAPLTSIAIYRLASAGTRVRYRFHRCTAPKGAAGSWHCR